MRSISFRMLLSKIFPSGAKRRKALRKQESKQGLLQKKSDCFHEERRKRVEHYPIWIFFNMPVEKGAENMHFVRKMRKISCD